jgi:hypothetical protein
MTIISLLVIRTTGNSFIWYDFAGLCLVGRLLVLWLTIDSPSHEQSALRSQAF